MIGPPPDGGEVCDVVLVVVVVAPIDTVAESEPLTPSDEADEAVSVPPLLPVVTVMLFQPTWFCASEAKVTFELPEVIDHPAGSVHASHALVAVTVPTLVTRAVKAKLWLGLAEEGGL